MYVAKHKVSYCSFILYIMSIRSDHGMILNSSNEVIINLHLSYEL